jgi:hypothetical protein
MTRYYFRDRDGFIIDDEGFELPDIEAAPREAVLSLAGFGRGSYEKAIGSLTDLAIEVRDDAGPVMQVSFNLHLLRRN